MARFVFITQVVDPDHPALGATVAKIRALAARADEVVVLALHAVPDSLPDNCRVLTFGATSRLARVKRFATAMTTATRLRPDAVLAHMAPVYAVLAAPWCRPRRVPLLLWYTHWRATRMLRAALLVSDIVVSVDVRSFPLSSHKVVPIGHGIDVDQLPCVGYRDTRGGLEVLSLGRYSAAKGIDTVVRAVAMTPGTNLVHHGPALTDAELAHRRELARLVDELHVADRVTLGDPVPRSEISDLFAAADVLVNDMRAGAPDKVVYEAAASCLTVVASNPVFDEFLPPELRFPSSDSTALAAVLDALRSVDRSRWGHELRQRVVTGHSVEHWADAIIRVTRDLGPR